jgi:hypothetical protein
MKEKIFQAHQCSRQFLEPVQFFKFHFVITHPVVVPVAQSSCCNSRIPPIRLHSISHTTQRLNVAPHECYTFFQLQHRHAHSLSHILESSGTSSLFYTHTLGSSRPLAHFETLTRSVLAHAHARLLSPSRALRDSHSICSTRQTVPLPAPQHRPRASIGSLRRLSPRSDAFETSTLPGFTSRPRRRLPCL